MKNIALLIMLIAGVVTMSSLFGLVLGAVFSASTPEHGLAAGVAGSMVTYVLFVVLMAGSDKL